MDYIIMEDMYESMSSGKVDKYLVQTGDKVKKGQPIAEIIAESGPPPILLLLKKLSAVSDRVSIAFKSEVAIDIQYPGESHSTPPVPGAPKFKLSSVPNKNANPTPCY